MKISEEDYLRRAIDLWRRAEWTIAFAVVAGQRVGCGLILPLKESSHELPGRVAGRR
jgi:hypothetical protein